MNEVLHSKQRRGPAYAIALAALILLVPAILNGFPFVFPDSGDYLVFTPHIYRSPYYGLLIFFFHLNRWIWMPLVGQALIVCHLLATILRLNGVRRVNSALILMAGFLALLSSLPYFVGFIMADIFTPIMFLAMYILAFHFADLSRPLKIYFLILTCVATAAHVSHVTIAGVMMVFLVLLMRWRGQKRAALYERVGILSIPLGLAAAAILLFNIAIFGSFSLVPAGPSFLMANLIQYGPARTYLDQACPSIPYKICAYMPQIAAAKNDPEIADKLLWSSGIFEKLGGFTGMKNESRAIVDATLRRYPLQVAKVVARNFMMGLFRHEPAAEFRSRYQVPSMSVLFKEKFGAKTQAAYFNSSEMRDAIPHRLIRDVDFIVTPAMFIALIWLGFAAMRRGDRQQAILAFFIIFAVLEDTLLCTSLSGIHDRYQARVTWLLPLGVFILAAAQSSKQKIETVNAPPS